MTVLSDRPASRVTLSEAKGLLRISRVASMSAGAVIGGALIGALYLHPPSGIAAGPRGPLAIDFATTANAATPTPVPTSRITIQFVRNGQPVSVTLAQPIDQILADGVRCFVATIPAVVESSGFAIDWPLPAEPGQPLQCTKGPPTTLRFEFSSEFGPLVAEFMWTGVDVTVVIEVPGSPTPAPAPSQTKQSLPAAGAPPGNPANARGVLMVTAIGALLIILSVATWLRLRR